MSSAELLKGTKAQTRALSRFDYTGLDPETAAKARAAADRIRKLGAQQNEAIFAIGEELIAIRAKLGYGNFGLWLHAEFDMSASTAERYIRVAGRFSTKFVTVTNLKPTTLYRLSAKSTPTSVLEKIITRIESGETLSDKEIRHLIAQARGAMELTSDGEEQAGAQCSEKAAIGRCATDPGTDRVVHQQAVVTMLFEAFDGYRLRELAEHLARAGWSDPMAEDELIQAIEKHCDALLPPGFTHMVGKAGTNHCHRRGDTVRSTVRDVRPISGERLFGARGPNH